MTELALPHATERVSSLLVVCLPTEGLVTGFEADKWTVVQRFDQEGDAKIRLQRILPTLASLKARAFLIRETDPRDRKKMVSWRTMVRYNEPEVYLDPSDAVEASPEALKHWADATLPFHMRPPAPAKPGPSRREPIILGASAAAGVAALVALLVVLSTPKIEVKPDPDLEFARQGGITLSVPDDRRPGWYVKLKIYPNQTVELVERFPAARLKAQSAGDARLEDVAAAFDRSILAQRDGAPNALGSKLEAISSGFKRR